MMVLVQLALAVLVASADPTYDTVFLQNGGRLRGVVVEEAPEVGVTIQLPTGEIRRVPAAQVLRVEYREAPIPGAAAAGAVPGMAPVPPPEAPPPGAPPPAGAPPPVPVLAPEVMPPAPYTLAVALGWAHASGQATSRVAMADLTKPQFVLDLEAGLRLLPALTLSGYLDIGGGGTSAYANNLCHAAGFACEAFTMHAGVLLRFAFTPAAPATAWFALGTGYEETEVASSDTYNDARLLTLSGWEFLRVSAGYDARGTGSVGLGIYALAGLGRFNTAEDITGRYHLASAPVHGWFQICIRSVIGP